VERQCAFLNIKNIKAKVNIYLKVFTFFSLLPTLRNHTKVWENSNQNW